MIIRVLLNMFLLLYGQALLAQVPHTPWRLGAFGGATCNYYSYERQYWDDMHVLPIWGGTAGAMLQYDIHDWMGIRADFTWLHRNHKLYRTADARGFNYYTINSYVALPVMASFSFGGETIRGFLNTGVYGAYWTGFRDWGNTPGVFDALPDRINEAREFDSTRDQRWDAGFVGGVGLEYRFKPRWGLQLELRCYYSTVSCTKDYQRLKDPHYNTTMAIQGGVYYEL